MARVSWGVPVEMRDVLQSRGVRPHHRDDASITSCWSSRRDLVEAWMQQKDLRAQIELCGCKRHGLWNSGRRRGRRQPQHRLATHLVQWRSSTRSAHYSRAADASPVPSWHATWHETRATGDVEEHRVTSREDVGAGRGPRGYVIAHLCKVVVGGSRGSVGSVLSERDVVAPSRCSGSRQAEDWSPPLPPRRDTVVEPPRREGRARPLLH